MSGPTTEHDADLHTHCHPLRAHTCQESSTLNDRSFSSANSPGFRPPSQVVGLCMDALEHWLSTQRHNDWSIGPCPAASLIGGRGLLSKLQDPTLAGAFLVQATKRTQTQLQLFPNVLLENTSVGRRHKPAFPTPDAQRNTSSGPWGACLLVVSRGCTRGNVWWSPIRNFQEEAVG